MSRKPDDDEVMELDQIDALQFSIIAPVWDEKKERYPFRIARFACGGRPRYFLLTLKQLCGPGALRTALLAQGVPTTTLGRRAFDSLIARSQSGMDFESSRVPIDEAQDYCDRLNQEWRS